MSDAGINYEGMSGPTDIPLRSECPKCGHVVWADETVNADLHDGAALRRLVEARGGKAVAILFHDGLWYCEAGVLPTPSGKTVAEAADKCREAAQAPR